MENDSPEILSLKKGFQQFYQQYFKDDPDLYQALMSNQNPHTLMIACCDSRISPTFLTQAQPGNLFTLRVIANMVPSYEESIASNHFISITTAIEFAVKVLDVKHIIVLGHKFCGGIQALVDSSNADSDLEFVPRWVSLRSQLTEKLKKEHDLESFEQKCRACEKENILLALDNLVTFPWIRKRIENKNLDIRGWYFDLETGDLEECLQSEAEFKSSFEA